MFSGLSDKLQATLKKLRGKGRVSEKDITEAMREVRIALLEADVNLKVVKEFVASVRERALGSDVLESLTPGQQIVKIVHEELTKLLGGSASRLAVASKPPTVVMLAGLQGAGKTSTAGKLAVALRKSGRHPLLVAADVYRPAAIEQLHVVGKSVDIPVFSLAGQLDPVEIVRQGREFAMRQGRDVVIIDTAGRLHINEQLMGELKAMKSAVKPHEILLVVDSMTGQDAVNVAQAFDEALGVDGIIMTKLDGDTRGGAALSVKSVTGKPIKYITMGEKTDALEVFHPERMASRILGMGDVLTLIEKAEQNYNKARAEELEKKLRSQSFTLEDFLEQLAQVRNMGPLDQIMGMIPGLGGSKQLQGIQPDEKELSRIEAIIFSMTPLERRRPEIIDGSRRKRIAVGSGSSVQDVNRLLKQFEQTRKMMKQLTDRSGGKKGKLKLPF